MEAKFTKGPWIVCEHDENALPGDFGLSIEQDGERCEGDPSIIAEVDICGDGIDLETGRANARLIAAAPALLEALRKMLEAFPPPPIKSRDGMAGNIAHACARAAIAKAEGGGV